MLDGDSSQDTIQPSAGVAPGKEAQAGDDDVDDLAMVAAAAAAEEALAHQGGIGSSAIDETEVARRAKLMSRPALLALRLAKEGTRKRREQQEREVEELPDLESDDWRQGGSSMGGGLSKGPSDKGTTVLGSGLTRSAGMKRRKLLSSKDGAGDEPVAFGLESVVFATAPHLTAPQRLSAKVRQQHLLTRPPMDGRSMSVLTEGGNMLYLRVKGGPVGEEGEDVDATLPLASRLAKLQSDVAADRLDGGKGGLLSMPMPELMKKVERRRYARLKARKELEAAQKKKKKEDEDEEEEDMKMVEDEQDKSTKRSMAPPPPQEQLWVNRYSPSAFPHLLSDEAINREVSLLFHVNTHVVSSDAHHTRLHTFITPQSIQSGPPPRALLGRVRLQARPAQDAGGAHHEQHGQQLVLPLQQGQAALEEGRQPEREAAAAATAARAAGEGAEGAGGGGGPLGQAGPPPPNPGDPSLRPPGCVRTCGNGSVLTGCRARYVCER